MVHCGALLLSMRALIIPGDSDKQEKENGVLLPAAPYRDP